MRLRFGSPALDTAARLLTPWILLYAVYVLVHGHDSPGGGFQAGTFLAAAAILLRLVRGEKPGWGPGPRGALVAAAAGAAVYAGIGLAALAFGGAYLDYGVLPLSADPVSSRVLATLGVETGVTLCVAGVMLLIFDSLAAADR